MKNKQLQLLLIIVICIILVSGCTKVEYITFEGLDLADSIILYKKKHHEFYNLEIDYDIYKDMYFKLFSDNFSIDEEVFARPMGASEYTEVTYKDLEGMKAKEIKKLMEEESLVTVFNMPNVDIESYKVMVSEVYADKELDWKYVFVREELIKKRGVSYRAIRYTFEKINGKYKIIMVDSDSRVGFSIDEFNSMSQEEKDTWIDKNKYQTFYSEPVIYTEEILFEY